MVARRTYRKPVPRGPRRYLRPAAPSMWQPICRTSTASWPTDLAGIEEIEDAVARRDIADLGRRIDDPPCVGTCVIAISLVRGPIALSSASRPSCPDASLPNTSIAIPTRAFICRNAR